MSLTIYSLFDVTNQFIQLTIIIGTVEIKDIAM